jgi:hypothetical protein
MPTLALVTALVTMVARAMEPAPTTLARAMVARVQATEQVGPATQAVAVAAQRTVRTACPKEKAGQTPRPGRTALKATAPGAMVLRVATVPGPPTTRSLISARR